MEPGIKAEQPSRRRRRAEHAAGGGRMEAPVVVIGWPQRHAEANLRFVAPDDGGNQFFTIGAGHFRRRQRRRDDGGAGMKRRTRVGVIEIQGMGLSTVNQRRAGRRKTAAVADNNRFAAIQAQHRRAFDQRRCRLGIMVGAKRNADVVHHQHGGTLHHVCRY